jgi:MFS family permease
MVRWDSPALLLVNRNLYFMQITSPVERGHAFAFLQVTMAIMGLVGSLAAGVIPGFLAIRLGSAVEQPGPYRIGLWAAPILYALAIFVLLGAREVKLPRKTSDLVNGSRSPIGLIFFFGLLTLMVSFGEGILQTFFNVYLDDGLGIPTVQIGTILGAGQFLGILSGLSAPIFLKQWGTHRTLLFATFGTMLSLAVLGLVPQLSGVVLGFIGTAIMIAAVSISSNIASQEAVSSPWRAAMSSGTTLGIAIGWASASFLGGYWISRLGYSTLFLLAAALSLVGYIMLYGFIRIYHRHDNQVET